MRTRIALVIAALGALVLLPAHLAVARPADADVVVGPATKVVGNGYGHGKGLSQYGANGAAKAGLTSGQILAFYYPGTSTGSFAGRVRVWISADRDHNTMVRPAKGLKVIDSGKGKAYTLPSIRLKAKAWRLSVVAGKTRVSYLAGGVWRAHRTGGRVALAGLGEFRTGANLVTLVIGGVNHVYRGGMRLAQGRTVNVLGIDQYLRGVIPSEMPSSWMPHALRAQAVAARTYATFERAANVNRSYQLCDTSECQVYRGYAVERPATNAAVVATAAQIRTYRGAPAFTQFSASNGGWSMAGGAKYPYLVAKKDPYDKAYQPWTPVKLDIAGLQRAYPSLGALKSVQVLGRDGAGAWGGRVTSIKLTYAKGSRAISGDTFRSWLGLRSTMITFTS